MTSIGCHYRCRFCADPAVFNRRRSAIPLDRVVTELSDLAGRYGVNDVNFQDETFFSSRRWTVELSTALIARGAPFTWAATMRADQGARLTDGDFDLLVRSGLRKLLIGVESGSATMLEKLGKDITLDQIETVAERCRDHKIAATYPFIFGIPGEESVDVEASLRLARRLKAMYWANTTPLSSTNPIRVPRSPIMQSSTASSCRKPSKSGRGSTMSPPRVRGWTTHHPARSNGRIFLPTRMGQTPLVGLTDPGAGALAVSLGLL